MPSISSAQYSARAREMHGKNDFFPDHADLQTYYDFAMELGAPPNHQMCRYRGVRAQHLVFLGESGTYAWARMDAMARQRWPDLPVAGKVAADKTLLASLPERIIYQFLTAGRPPCVAIDLHQPIDDNSDEFRADITLRCRDAAHFIEVVGCCAHDRVVRNAVEKRGLIRTEQRERFYESRGMQPSLIFLDDFARPQELKAQCTALIERVLRDAEGRKKP
ncbi:hypothetical protein [Acetobacter indonesiensis]|uniref:hypothetical protein n=1 Tax=Acetobacter indonesiensis TaxID=104101 RepID=UPI0020A2F254|nr:hypothetical protein [Acetobacter indonesiensis]MCP1231397.1 hypothetical protein [Acetobacter indonesiensis]